MKRIATASLIAAIFLGGGIPPIAGPAVPGTAATLLPALQPLLEALRPQDASELAQALLLACVFAGLSSGGRNAGDGRLGGLAVGAALAGGVWAAGDLPAAGNAVLAAINQAEFPVVDWVSGLVEAAAAR